MLFHIATVSDWTAALTEGAYRVSTRGVRLEDAGFIHCAREDQVAGVANRFYRRIDDDLVLLAIDPDLVDAEVREEDTDGTGATFPHLYGALPLTAVVAAVPFSPGPDGTYAFRR